MSIAAINWALNAKTGSPTAKLVLIKLADNADDEGRCYPSRKNISQQCELSVATISRTIKKLEESGHITVVRETFDGVKQRNRYRLNLSLVGAERAQGRRTESLGVGAQCVSEPPLEPPVNHKSARKTASRLPENWQPPPDWIDFAISEGFSNDEAFREAAIFKDYWIARPGEKGRKLNWLATWRNWIRRSDGFGKTAKTDRQCSGIEQFIRNGQVPETSVHPTGREPDYDSERLEDRRASSVA